ncbi:non-homologous end-joining DNA ligase [Acidimangrovimonas sediminis]|uniref:non-homologous end-joining DNA ligase n=1 Tax=Acidimangrovimonas sediminis TaxID=2056283 RepID=UPI000C80CA45|nr:non-homologous end-joining DNA ligase [Acidimangrovimonas sediminis]
MADGNVTIAGIRISHPDREVYPDTGIRKRDVATYCKRMAGPILETAANRPLSLVRLPEGMEGQRFFQKHAGAGFPEVIRRMEIEESDGETADYMYVTDAAGLVGAVQMGTLEFHIWGARRDRLDRPERMIFDLDPGEGLDFAEVTSAARDLRDLLADLGLGAWPLVTGGKGVHVVVPLRRTVGWDAVTLYARVLSKHLADTQPGRFTATMSKAHRAGRIFIDWLRNERGATAIAPFSPRARPGAPVAVPVGWDELATLSAANVFGLAKAEERGWNDVAIPKPQSLAQKHIDALDALVAADKP